MLPRENRLEGAAQVFIPSPQSSVHERVQEAWKSKAKPRQGVDPTATFLFIDVTVAEGQDRRTSTIVEMSKLLREYDSEYHFLFSHVLRFVDSRRLRRSWLHDPQRAPARAGCVFLPSNVRGAGGFQASLRSCVRIIRRSTGEAGRARTFSPRFESHSDNVDDLLSFSTMTLEETRGAAITLFAMMEEVDAKHLVRLKSLCG